jgi:hypothetical protein
LHGFNITSQLIHELFSELDSHKKGYISLNEWQNYFGHFNWKDHVLLELKNAVASYFPNSEAAYDFFISFCVTAIKNSASAPQTVNKSRSPLSKSFDSIS